MPAYVSLALAGLAAFLLVVGIGFFRTAPAERTAAALLRDTTTGAAVERKSGSLLRHLLPPAPGILLARADLAAIDVRLANAGRPYSLSATEFVRLRTLVAALVAVLAVLVFVDSSPIVVALIGIAAAAAGYRLPDMWISGRASAVSKEIERGLPDMVDSLVLALDAGMDLEAALRRLVPRLRGALREEWDQVLAELAAGYSLTQSLERLQARSRSQEQAELVSLMQQSRRLGTGLSGALRERAGELRTTRRLRASEEAQQAPLKMMIPLVLFFLPALLVVFIGPAALSLLGAR
ncbi:MAG: type II secretion system F family protein [Chloroflexi bacterium]|nr:type II secretion system F family protein [Chloroflexota bacterium]